MSGYSKCSVALPYDAVGWLQYVTVVFPDHTHLLFYVQRKLYAKSLKNGFGMHSQLGCYSICCCYCLFSSFLHSHTLIKMAAWRHLEKLHFN